MLDSFEILTTSGVVLWSKVYAPVSSNVVDSLIRDVFIEERLLSGAMKGEDAAAARNPAYKKDKYTLKWITAKELGLVFVAVYQSLIHLSWIDKLLDNIKIIFCNLYGDRVGKSPTGEVDCRNFDAYFDRQLQELEESAGGVFTADSTPTTQLTPPTSSDSQASVDEPPPLPGAKLGLAPPQLTTAGGIVSTDATPLDTPETSRPASPAVNNHLLTAKGPSGKLSRRMRKGAKESAPSSGDERQKLPGKGGPKKGRKWDVDGMLDEDDSRQLDYSSRGESDERTGNAADMEEVSQESWGKRTARGEFVLKDLDEEMDAILSKQKQASSTSQSQGGVLGSGLSVVSGLFRNIVGGKTLTKEDLAKPLNGMLEHLLRKNVAREAALRLCNSVERDLVGQQTGSFESADRMIRTSMTSALTKILTPTTSLDLLRSIQAVASPPPTSLVKARPYVLSIVGVNGVGKSTNLSKIAFFLLQNRFKVLIVAADTFRSGAVEQLRVHARNLSELSSRENNGSSVELFERGYGKDAAEIARQGIEYAATKAVNVVLIDTAGRRHNDQRLMSSLEKFGKLANPDKILMVGEALVGTDSVAQARNFNEAFGASRGLDGFVISKCDTVGDMVGVLVSMVHSTGVPVVFLGVGQHYSDLRTLNVTWAVNLLMS